MRVRALKRPSTDDRSGRPDERPDEVRIVWADHIEVEPGGSRQGEGVSVDLTLFVYCFRNSPAEDQWYRIQFMTDRDDIKCVAGRTGIEAAAFDQQGVGSRIRQGERTGIRRGSAEIAIEHLVSKRIDHCPLRAAATGARGDIEIKNVAGIGIESIEIRAH